MTPHTASCANLRSLQLDTPVEKLEEVVSTAHACCQSSESAQDVLSVVLLYSPPLPSPNPSDRWTVEACAGPGWTSLDLTRLPLARSRDARLATTGPFLYRLPPRNGLVLRAGRVYGRTQLHPRKSGLLRPTLSLPH